MPSVLTAQKWGFYDDLFDGKPFTFQMDDWGSYVMENILFKISYSAEFHAQTAIEAGVDLHRQIVGRLAANGDSSAVNSYIEKVEIVTHEAGNRIINKTGPLYNYADRDQCIQYMVAIALLKGNLEATDYSDEVAALPEIDSLRDKMNVTEDKWFTTEYHDPSKRYIGNK